MVYQTPSRMPCTSSHQTNYGRLPLMLSSHLCVTFLPNQERVSESPRHPPSRWAHAVVSIYFGLLHFSSLDKFTSRSTTQCNAHIHLSRGDISFTSDGSLCLQLKATKTALYHEGCPLLIAPSSRSVWLCSLSNLQLFSPVFSHQGSYTLCLPLWSLLD